MVLLILLGGSMKVKAKINFIKFSNRKNKEFHFEEGKEYFAIQRKNDVMVKHPDGYLVIIGKTEFEERFENL